MSNDLVRALLPYAGRLGIFPTHVDGDLAKVPAGARMFPDVRGEARSDATGALVVELRGRATLAEEIERWWAGTRAYGVGLCCGDYQCLDFDDPSIIAAWRASLKDHGLDHLLDLTARSQTMSGGFHVWAYVPGCREESYKLARHAAPVYDVRRGKEVLARIETRGRGGYALIPPSKGYRWLTANTILDLEPMASEDFDRLLLAATMLDEGAPEPTPIPPVPRPRRTAEESPNEWFERTADWQELFAQADGRFFRQVGGRLQFTRPGKSKGVSATTGNGLAGQDLAKIHTPNWPPFEVGEVLSKYYFYAALHHARDKQAATRAIAAMPGYAGRDRSPKTRAASRSDASDDAEDDLDSVREDAEDSPLALPLIQWNLRQLPDVTADAISALVASNDPRHLFDRGGKVVRVVEDKDGGFKIDNLGAAAMRNEIGKAANWARLNDKGRLVGGYVPKEIAENVLAEQGLAKSFPRLEGLSSVPVLSPSGSFCRSHGYDPESGFFVTGHGPFPDFAGDGRAAARWILDELFQDFPFEDDGGASRANALGLGLLPYVRAAIDGGTPMHYVEAPQSRTGKSLLVEVALLPSLGKVGVSSTPLPEKEEELAKTLSGKLYEGDQLVFFDNVKRRVSSSSLEQVLTAQVYQFRPLGATASLRVPVKAIFALTTNNGTLSIDMAGRCVLVRIDARMERPEDREGTFRHDNIRAFIEENRPLIRSAYMAMVEEWVRAGRPRGERKKASYVEWSQTIGGILDVCGVPGFLLNDRNLKGTAADEDEPWRAFYECWWAEHADRVVTGTTLCQLAESRQMMEEVFASAKTEKGRPMAFGKALSAREGKVLDGRRPAMEKRPDGKPSLGHGGQKQYRLLPLGSAPAPPSDAFDFDAARGEADPFADD